ncbi:hypothetical protein RUND412_002389 [Rhizina undulata]
MAVSNPTSTFLLLLFFQASHAISFPESLKRSSGFYHLRRKILRHYIRVLPGMDSYNLGDRKRFNSLLLAFHRRVFFKGTFFLLYSAAARKLLRKNLYNAVENEAVHSTGELHLLPKRDLHLRIQQRHSRRGDNLDASAVTSMSNASGDGNVAISAERVNFTALSIVLVFGDLRYIQQGTSPRLLMWDIQLRENLPQFRRQRHAYKHPPQLPLPGLIYSQNPDALRNHLHSDINNRVFVDYTINGRYFGQNKLNNMLADFPTWREILNYDPGDLTEEDRRRRIRKEIAENDTKILAQIQKRAPEELFSWREREERFQREAKLARA